MNKARKQFEKIMTVLLPGLIAFGSCHFSHFLRAYLSRQTSCLVDCHISNPRQDFKEPCIMECKGTFGNFPMSDFSIVPHMSHPSIPRRYLVSWRALRFPAPGYPRRQLRMPMYGNRRREWLGYSGHGTGEMWSMSEIDLETPNGSLGCAVPRRQTTPTLLTTPT